MKNKITISDSISKEILGEKPRILSSEEAAWLAGVIDGEGSIGLYNFGGEGRRVEMSETLMRNLLTSVSS